MYLARVRPKRSRLVGDENGMMILQVVITSIVLLGVLLAGFKTVQTTIKAANSTATSAGFKDLVLSVQQNLATTNLCTARLGLSGVAIATIRTQSTSQNGYPVTVRRANLQPPHLAVKEPAKLPANSPPGSFSPEFKIIEVSLRNVRNLGWPGALPAMNGGAVGTQEITKVGADLTIVAERRSGFLGSAMMTAQVPLLLGVDSLQRVQMCATRSMYQVELGPPGVISVQRKSGVECIDRGGVPIIDPESPENAPWYVCRLPISTFLACSTERSNLPGWVCRRPTVINQTTKTGFTDVY